VAKAIRASLGKTDRATLGEWFQLKLAKALKDIGEVPVLEEVIDNNPKDILIREGRIHIECKTFCYPTVCHAIHLEYDKVFKRLREALPDGDWIVFFKGEYVTDYFAPIILAPKDSIQNYDLFEVYKDDSPSFKLLDVESVIKSGIPQIQFYGRQYLDGEKLVPMANFCIPGLLNVRLIGPDINFVNTFLNPLHDKYKQMIDDAYNVLALDVSHIVGDFDVLRNELLKALLNSPYDKLHGILLGTTDGDGFRRQQMTYKPHDSLSLIATSIFENLPKVIPV